MFKAKLLLSLLAPLATLPFLAVAVRRHSAATGGSAATPQAAAGRDPEDVLRRVADRGAPITALAGYVDQLAIYVQQVPEQKDAGFARKVAGNVDEAQKLARNFGEDLDGDMLALDNLDGLAEKDRGRRKNAIAEIEDLLKKVDAAKARLGAMAMDLSASRGAHTTGRQHPAATAGSAAKPKAGAAAAAARRDHQSSGANPKIEDVLRHVADRRAPITALAGSVHQLASDVQQARKQKDAGFAREVAGRVDEAQKLARNFGEDLVGYMVALDNLDGLAEKDRGRRRNAIAEIEDLLGEVDAAKARLGAMAKDLSASLTPWSSKRRTRP